MAGHIDKIEDAVGELVEGIDVEDVMEIVEIAKSSPRRKAFMKVVEKAIWTGVQSGLAMLTVPGLLGHDSDPKVMLITAAAAAAISAIKNLAAERQGILGK